MRNSTNNDKNVFIENKRFFEQINKRTEEVFTYLICPAWQNDILDLAQACISETDDEAKQIYLLTKSIKLDYVDDYELKINAVGGLIGDMIWDMISEIDFYEIAKEILSQVRRLELAA